MPKKYRKTLTDLLPQTPPDKAPRRQEHVGRPKDRPRIDFKKLMAREIEHIMKREEL